MTGTGGWRGHWPHNPRNVSKSSPGTPGESPTARRKDEVDHLNPQNEPRRLRKSGAEQGPPPEFFGNVIGELRRHWVDPAAERKGIDPAMVDRALIIGATGEAEVRLNEAVKAAVYVGDDRIVDLDRAVELKSEGGEETWIRGLVPDVPPDEPFSFFDLRLGYLSVDYRRRQRAKRHMTIAEQFWYAARELVLRGGLGAACENMFAATELATMALMEVSQNAGWGHSKRSEWLRANGPAHGLTDEEAATLGVLHEARNVYRYGDTTSEITPVSLIELVPHVSAVLAISRSAVESSNEN